MANHFYQSKLILRFTFSFIIHQILLFSFISVPTFLFFYVFEFEPINSNYDLLAWVTIILYGIYCLFYGYYVAYPMIDIITKVRKLSHGGFLEPDGRKRFSPFSSRLYREVYANLTELSESLKRNEKERKEFEQMRSEWAAGITHDLKTPLSYIKGYSEILFSNGYQWTAEEKKEFLSIIHKNSLHLESLVNDLGMAFHMDEIKDFPIHVESLDFAELLRQCLAEVANTPYDIQNDFEFISADTKIFSYGDAALLKRAFLNILTNTIIHNKKSVKVITNIKKESDKVIIIITDNGEGIDEEDLKHLFDRYYRGTNTDQNTNATGLGMAITQQIINAHGGTITVSSKKNKFTRFKIILPKESL